MADGYLFKNGSGQIGVGKMALDQTGKFAQKRNEFLLRNQELQQSLWAGRDSSSMSDVKNSYATLNDLMNEEIPPIDSEEFEARKTAIEDCYTRLIHNCQEYIKTHKHPFTKNGKKRKAMVTAILSSAELEKVSVSLAVDSLKEHVEEGMIWGNLFGEMQENVDLCEGVYDKFDTQFPEEKEAPAGAVSMELAKYVSGIYALKDEDYAVQPIYDMATVWIKNNMTEELKKEFKQFRTFIMRILLNDYRTAFDHAPNKKDLLLDKNNDDLMRHQMVSLWILNTEHYAYYKSLRELAPLFGEERMKCGVPGEEIINEIRETPDYFTRLKPEAVMAELKKIRYYRKVDARNFLQGYLPDDKLDEVLGEGLMRRENDAVPFEMKLPSAKTAGTEKLEGEFFQTDYMRKVNRTVFYREDALKDEEGEDAEAKYESFMDRLSKKYGDKIFNSNLENSDGTIGISGLNTARMLTNLVQSPGGTLTSADIERLYDKLLARSRIGEGEGKISAEEADRLFMEGINDLVDIYLKHLQRMEATYGRLILQMHPEDIFRQVGDEFYDQMCIAQDLMQIKEFLFLYGDTESRKVREFIMLSDYFFNINQRSLTYYGRVTEKTDEGTYRDIEGQESIRDLQNTSRYDSIKGPRMTAAQKKKYNANLKKRFDEKNKELEDQEKHIRATVKDPRAQAQMLNDINKNWHLRIYGEFRGMS